MSCVARFHWCACALLGLALAGSSSRDAEAQPLRAPQDPCAAAAPGGPIQHRGTTLLETADIKTPEIRRINVLISTRCYGAAAAAIARYRAEAPQDYQIEFVANRLTWLTVGPEAGLEAVTESLARHPDFASMKVLQASHYLDQERYDDARLLLDQVAKTIPNDLWLMIDRMRIELHEGARPDMAARMVDMVNNAQFPPSAREMAAWALSDLPGADYSAVVAAYRTLLTFESATPFNRKAMSLARQLVLKGKKPDESIQFLEQTMADPRAARRVDEIKELLAIALLQKAVTIDATPTARNAALIARSGELIDHATMYRSLVYIPNGAKLRILIADKVDLTKLPGGGG